MLNIKKEEKNTYLVYNDKQQFLGEISKKRVGRFIHWCFFPERCNFGELWFTNGCLKEITTFITKLYSIDKNEKNTND